MQSLKIVITISIKYGKMVCIDNKSDDSEKLEIEDRDRSGSCYVD